MPLPDVSHLDSLSFERWSEVGRILAQKGVTAKAIESINATAASLPAPMRRPILLWNARRVGGDAGVLMRIFVFRDPVPATEASGALGKYFEPLLTSGLLLREGDRVVSALILNVYDDLFVFVDDLAHGGDAAMGSGPTTTALMIAAIPLSPVSAVLDVGCGAGTIALALARHAKRSVGVDINPRAVAIAKLNAALNGLTNVEFRVGDLLAPVGSEKFDIIVGQPPFVARPRGAADTTYMYGGERGDELPLRALASISGHLTERGRALIFVEWPEIEGDPIEKRARAVVPRDHDLFLLQCPPTNLDQYSAWYAALEHPHLDDDFARLTIAQREHFERLGVTALRRTFNVIEPGEGLTATIAIKPLASIRATSPRIDKLVLAQRLLARDEAALLDATLRVPKGTTFVEERLEATPGFDADRQIARLPEGSLFPDVGINEEARTVTALIHQSATVRDAVELMTRTLNADPEFAKRKILPHAREALSRGLLLIPTRQA